MSAFAIDDGDTMSYTGRRVGDDETSVFTSGDYTGTCAQQGVTLASSGRASVDKRGNSSKLAKLIYRYAIEEDWFTGPHATDSAKNVLGLTGSTVFTKRRLVECLCQITIQGKSDWYSISTSAAGGSISTGTANAILDWYDSIDTSNINVPSGFEVFLCDAGSHQNFVLWRYKSKGFLKLKKASANTAITG